MHRQRSTSACNRFNRLEFEFQNVFDNSLSSRHVQVRKTFADVSSADGLRTNLTGFAISSQLCILVQVLLPTLAGLFVAQPISVCHVV